jgi:DNA-binding transcriptional ArsR family regulator
MSPRRSEPLVDLVTSRMAVLSDPTRVHLLELLEEGDATVRELSDQLPSTPQNVSRHLGILRRAGIVASARDGRSVKYSLVDYAACRVFDHVLASIAGQIDDLSDLVSPAA